MRRKSNPRWHAAWPAGPWRRSARLDRPTMRVAIAAGDRRGAEPGRRRQDREQAEPAPPSRESIGRSVVSELDSRPAPFAGFLDHHKFTRVRNRQNPRPIALDLMSGHRGLEVLQCQNGMNEHEQRQCDRQGDMNSQPRMQPEVHPRLQIELPALIAEVGQAVHHGVGRRRQAGLQGLEHRSRLRRLTQRQSPSRAGAQVRLDLVPVEGEQGVRPGDPAGLDADLHDFALQPADLPHRPHGDIRASERRRPRRASFDLPRLRRAGRRSASTSRCGLGAILFEDVPDLGVDRLGRHLFEHEPGQDVLQDEPEHAAADHQDQQPHENGGERGACQVEMKPAVQERAGEASAARARCGPSSRAWSGPAASRATAIFGARAASRTE